MGTRDPELPMKARASFAAILLVLGTGLASLGATTAQAADASLAEQLVGTWNDVSSKGRRDDGSDIQRPALQGSVTYLPDGRFFSSPRR